MLPYGRFVGKGFAAAVSVLMCDVAPGVAPLYHTVQGPRLAAPRDGPTFKLGYYRAARSVKDSVPC